MDAARTQVRANESRSGPAPRAERAGPGQRRATTAGSPTGNGDREPDVHRILGLFVPVTVMLADRYMSIGSILGMSVGTIIEFDVPFDSELVLEVAGRPIGKGTAVKVGENFGLRISEIGPVSERIDAMRGR